MKRKWLIAIASLAMAISFVLGVSACAPKEDSKSDDEIAQAAINTLNSLYIKDGEVKNYETPDKYTVLGKVNVDDELYTVTWTAAAKTDGVNIADYVTVGEIDSKNQVEIGIKRATVDVEYTLTASVTVGKTTKTADYGHKIPKKSSEEAVTASLDLSDKANRTSLDVDNGEQVWQQNGITLTNTGDVADYAPVRLYKNTTVKIEMENAKIIHIDFHSASGFSDSPYPEDLLTSLQNSDLPIKGEIALAEDGLTISVDFETPQEVVTFKATAGQCRLTSIDVEAIERDPDEHVHKWTYEHIANTWTHKATCTAEGCDVNTKTEDCEPKLNVCECGYTYSAKEIVDALFALDTNGSLPGTYSLTGVVTEITDAYSTQYKNVTFDMEVEGQTITVFRAKGTYATEVAVGGTATVNGSLLDYSGKKEFTSGCAVVAFTPGVDERTADEKAEAALAKVAETLTITATGTQTLATSSEREVTFAWAVKSGDSLPDGITLADGKLSVTKLPEEEKSFQLVVTATIAEATQTHTKTVTVTVKSQGTQPLPSGELTLTGDKLATALGGKSGYQTGTYTIDGVPITIASVMSNDAYYDGSTEYPYGYNVIQFRKTDGTLSLNGTFTKVSIVIASSYTYSNAWLSLTAGTTTIAETSHTEEDANFTTGTFSWKFYTVEYDITTSGEQTITIKAGSYAVYVKSITLTGSASGGGTVDPEPEPTEGLLYTLTSTTKGENTNANDINSYTVSSPCTVDGITWDVLGNTQIGTGQYDVPNWRFGGKDSTCVAADRTITGRGAINGTVKSVVITFGATNGSITVNSVKLKVYDTDPGTGSPNPIATKDVEWAANGTYTVTADGAGWTNCYYQLVMNLTSTATSNKWIVVDNIKFYSGGGSVDPQPTGALELTSESFGILDDSQSSTYNKYKGTHTVGSYQVALSDAMPNSYEGYQTIQFKKKDGTLKVTGEFTRVTIVVVSVYPDEADHVFLVSAGTTALTYSLIKTEDTGKSNSTGAIKLYTLEYISTATGAQEFTISAPTGKAGYAYSIVLDKGSATAPETDDSKVEKALAGVNATLTVEEAGDFALPTSKVDGVTFTWSTEDKTYTIAGGALKVEALPKADVTIVLTLTATCNQATKTKQVTVTIKAEEPFKPIKTPVAAINYYMGMKTQDGKYHYITGAMASGSASHYMATVTDIAQAKRVTLSGSDTDGWTMMCEGKYIEIVKSGTYYNAVYTTTSSGTWKWDATHNFFTWTISGAVYALGTYGTFTTVGTVAESRFNDSGEWFAVLGLYGDETAQLPSDQNYAQQVLDSLTIPSATLNKVGASLTLPTSTAHGATVVWTATGENASLVTIEGTKLSVAKVPQTETTVTLHCVVTINDASVEKDFTVTVRDLNDKEKADAVVTALDKLFKDKTFWTLDKVSILPTENDYSATVVWTLAEAGKEYFKIEDNKLSVLKLYEGANHSNQKFTITLTVTVGEEVSTKDFTLYLYSPDTFTAETSAPEYGYYFIAAYDPAENPNNSSRRDLLNGTTLGTNGGTNGNLQSTTYDSSAQLFLIIPIPNQENAYWIKWTKSGTNYLQISLSSNKPCVAWSTLSESATKSGVWHWDDEKDILYVTLADKNYVICSNYYGQGLKAYEMTDAEAHSGYWWAKIGKLSTREADLQKAPPQATSVEFYTVKGVKLADGAEIALKAESGWNSYFFYKVLPEGAEQGLSIATSTVNKLNVMVNNDQTIGVRIGVGSAGVLGDEVTVTFTVRDTAMTFTFKVKLVENVTVIKGETPENPISIDVLYNRVKRADDAYPGIKVSPGYNRPYYVTGRLHIAEDGTYYLQDDDGKQIKLSKRFTFAGEAAGLTIGDLSEGEVVTLGASWYFIQEDDAKMLASNTVPCVYKADIETDNEKVENVQGRLDVDFTPIKGIDAIGKSVDLTEMANKAKAGEYGVTVKWELTAPTDVATYLEIKENKLTALKLPEKSTTFKLTATISKEGVETPLTKTFSFNLSYTADVAIAETIKNFAPDYSSLQKAGDMIDLDAAVAAARGESKVYASWANPEANPYWTTKVVNGKMCLVVTEMPKEAMTFTFSGTFILSPGTRVDATFTFTLGPAA